MRLKALIVSLIVVGMVLGTASLALAQPRLLSSEEMTAAIGGNGCMIFHQCNKTEECYLGCICPFHGSEDECYRCWWTYKTCGWAVWGTCANDETCYCACRWFQHRVDDVCVGPYGDYWYPSHDCCEE